MKENGEIKSWDDLKKEFKLEQRLYFKWMQLVDTLSGNWKKNLKLSDTNSQNLILLYHHLVKFNSLFSIGKLESRELYCIINSSRNNKPTLQIYLKRSLIRRIGLEGHSYITTKNYHEHVFKIVSI